MFKWDKPKASIRKIVLVFSFLMSVVSVVGLITLYILFYKAELVTKIDKKLVENYIYTIRYNYDESKRLYSTGKKDQSLDFLELSYQSLEHIGKVDKNYEFKRDVMTLLVERYIGGKQYRKAMEVIKKWSEEDPIDIDAKLLYLYVLGLQGEMQDSILIKYEELFREYYNVEKVAQQYYDYCVDNDLVECAERVGDSFSSSQQANYLNDVFFKIYYIDNINGDITYYSEGQSESVAPMTTDATGRQYVNIDMAFTSLEALRLDLETIFSDVEFSLGGFSVELKSDRGNFVLQPSAIGAKNGIQINGNDIYMRGNDPYMMFDLPDELSGYRGVLSVRFVFDLGLKIRKLNEKL